MSTYHVPVMAQACLDLLDIKPEGIYVDVTFGGGGHSKLILEQLGPKGRLIAFDQDPDAANNVPDDPRIRFIPHNFSTLDRWARVLKIEAVDGILADLGVSSHQFDEAERGFSYRYDALLDMRMSQDGATAADLLATMSEAEMQEMFSAYGEVRNARTLARKIAEQRDARNIRTVADLLAICEPLAMGHRPRYMAQVFQSLRIAVNDELGTLKNLLTHSLALLKPEGRMVVMSYHSLEDRLVKYFFNSGNFENTLQKDFYGNIFKPFNVLTKKAIEPTEAETQENSRARSARLRAAAKK